MSKHKFIKNQANIPLEFTLDNIDSKKIDQDYELNSISTVCKIGKIPNNNHSTSILSFTNKPVETIVSKDQLQLQKYLSLTLNDTNKNIMKR